jgi:16S rRNA G966 N2-methylase RsmD
LEDETGRYEGRRMKVKGKKGGKLRHSKTRIKTVFFNITKRNISWSYLKAR